MFKFARYFWLTGLRRSGNHALQTWLLGPFGKRAIKLNYTVEIVGDKIHRQLTLDPATNKVLSTKDLPTTYPGEQIKGEPVKTESGLMYYDLRVGDGPSPSGPADTVTVHYTGWLTDGRKFDSSVDKGQPFVRPLRGLIKGWVEGIGSMTIILVVRVKNPD